MSALSPQDFRIPIAYVRAGDGETPNGIPCYVSVEWFQYLNPQIALRLGGANGLSNQEIQVELQTLEATTSLHTTQIAEIGVSINDIYTSIASLPVIELGTMTRSISDIRAEIAAAPVFNPGYLEKRIHDLEVLGADV